ncbi:Serine/threonine protein kinase [Pseudoloma neurophilia]|uniref:Aurora kinase n=1 Tax=Pseudoloma neurophilia TaxID=146866 RepID=A0A0R0M1C0_9MICR|nr:Serine/threonine protein kinase [Pseudoloma neurophilia]
MKNWTLDDFELGAPLGAGQFGQVWLAKEKKSGFIISLKIIDKNIIRDNENFKHLRRELEIQSKLNCPYILKYYGHFHDKKNIYLIIEYAKGELFRKLSEKGRFDDRTASLYIYQVLLALKNMHENKIIHRDLKPENILIGFDGKLRIADFGWAVCNLDNKRATFCGTHEYLSPEMIDKSLHNEKVDMWCVGILTYELLSGSTPFQAPDRSSREAYRRIKNLEFDIPSYLSKTARTFISRLLVVENKLRPSAIEMLNDPWILQYQ